MKEKEHKPEGDLENDDTKLLWIMAIHIEARRPDILSLIRKIAKYQDMKREIGRI